MDFHNRREAEEAFDLMNLKTYETRYRIRVRRSEDGCPEIPGRWGNIFVFNHRLLGWHLMNRPDRDYKEFLIKQYVRTGKLELRAEGETEAVFIFHPRFLSDVLRLCGVKKKGGQRNARPAC